MSDKLKQFVSEHKHEFDTNEPNKDLWKKIDARMEVKKSSRISSKWLSGIKYLGFSASVLVVAIYFIANSSNSSSVNETAINKEEQVTNNSDQRKPIENNTIKELNDLAVTTNNQDSHRNEKPANTSSTGEQNKVAVQTSEKDSVPDLISVETGISDQKKLKPETINEKKENIRVKKNNKPEIVIPAEPVKTNSYTGTLYVGPSFCSLIHAYKFPGKVHLDKLAGIRGSKKGYSKKTVRTISCSRLEDMADMKAVWVKGKTDKEISLSVGKRFKNILLVKSDGRKLSPAAISHYYPGLGVISEYRGTYFNIIFKDKVDLILFFKDVQEGDKIIIDSAIEVVVKDKP